MRIPPTTTTISLAHLDALSTWLDIDGTRMLATRVYADAPDYRPVGDADEGIACVDDVARAAIVYLDEHARTGSAHALDQARGALEFTMRMAGRDGRFTNFITDEHGTRYLARLREDVVAWLAALRDLGVDRPFTTVLSTGPRW